MTRNMAAEAEQKSTYKDPIFDANFEHWSKAEYWRIHEATLLALGKDPHKVEFEDLKKFQHRSHFAKDYFNLRELIKRAYLGGQYDEIDPLKFIKWAKSKNIDIPIRLDKLLLENNKTAPEDKVLYEALEKQYSELSKKHNELFEKSKKLTTENKSLKNSAESKNIIIGVLSHKEENRVIHYDPSKAKNDITSSICSGAAKVGCEISPPTVLKHLKEAHNKIDNIKNITNQMPLRSD